MNPRLLSALLLVTPALAAQTPPATAQQPEPDSPAFILRQEVRNVVVDVVVTDKHGQPVTGLDRSSFHVYENGAPQLIAYFGRHLPGEPAPAAVPTASPRPPHVHTNLASGPPSGPLLVLLLDALNTAPADQSYIRAQAIEYLRQIPAGTHMAICTLGDNLQLIQGFTSDPALLKAALDNKSYPAFVSLDASNAGSLTSVRSSLNRWANESTSLSAELDVRYTLDALNALSVYLSGIPGRKSLIWFAGTLPWTINPDFSLVTGVTGRVDYGDQLKQLANLMTIGRISIYPVDAHALVTPGGYSPDNAPTAGNGARGSHPSGPSSTGSLDVSGSPYGGRGQGGNFGYRDLHEQMNAAGNHMSMVNLATATGGRAFYNTNGIAGAVATVNSIGESYYTLVYSPSNKSYDGGFRQLEVRAADPSLKLDYRRGYYAEDPAKAAKRNQVVYTNPLRLVMQHGAPDATQIPFHIQDAVAPVQPDPSQPAARLGALAASLRGQIVRYDFHWNVDPRAVGFTASSGFHRGELDVTVAAYDGDGKIVNSIYSSLPLNLSDALYDRVERSGLPIKQTLDIPSSAVFVRVAVLDPATGHTGATEFPFDVPATH
ncbi:MAG: VWA domain-containing protein [Terracidiphilus sp.]